MDFEVIFQQINLNTALTFSLQNLAAKFRQSLASFGKTLTKFRQSFFEPCSRKIEIFSAKPNFSSLICGGLYDASSGFCRLDKKGLT